MPRPGPGLPRRLPAAPRVRRRKYRPDERALPPEAQEHAPSPRGPRRRRPRKASRRLRPRPRRGHGERRFVGVQGRRGGDETSLRGRRRRRRGGDGRGGPRDAGGGGQGAQLQRGAGPGAGAGTGTGARAGTRAGAGAGSRGNPLRVQAEAVLAGQRQPDAVGLGGPGEWSKVPAVAAGGLRGGVPSPKRVRRPRQAREQVEEAALPELRRLYEQPLQPRLVPEYAPAPQERRRPLGMGPG
mmetsp:Transcript_2384/g.8035  ORF Transcript_2384/g.8035 Transcript_2384/m.8035 type:complete len:241 (-) Transcript_2384:1039-1761(-)